MILAMSYETAQRMDSNFNITMIILIITIALIGCISIKMLDTIIIPIILLIVFVGLYIFNNSFKPDNVETVVKQQLPKKQNELETLKTKRLELVKQNANKEKIKKLNQKISKLQITINHYNYIINQNN